MSETKTTKWVRLGDYIEQCSLTNSELRYGVNDAMGMTITKEIIPTKADLKDTDLSKFLVVKPNEFVYNPRTHGRRIGLGYNNSNRSFIISWNNIAFRVSDTNALLPEYLYMIICRDEWDRNACFRSWGSSTEVFSWSEFELMEIPLPDIEVQRELVATYNGLKALAEQNEALLPQLSAACHAYIVDCRAKYPAVPLGEYIEVLDKRNIECKPYPFYGINKDKTFMPTVADTNELDKTKYRVVEKGNFVFSGMQTGRDVCIRIALFDHEYPIIISPAYTTFKIKNSNELLPEFLFLHFNRKESDRYGWFLSDGSIRSNLDWERFRDIKIAIPPIKIQKAIVEVFKCSERAKKIATEARERMKNICPALVQRAANS